MKLTERVAFMKGLMEGLEIDSATKEGKVLLQMADVLSDCAAYIDDLQSQVDELTELCDMLDEDLGTVEEDLYNYDDQDEDNDDDDYDEYYDDFGDDDEDDDEDSDFSDSDDDDDDDEDELYEVVCPSCGDTILVDETMLEGGSVNRPNCNELLEFDIDDLTIEDIEDMSGSEDSE